MQYYHNLITQKSWQLLRHLKQQLDFVLIGGWAVWLYAKTLKSKDIDIIVDFNQLEKLRLRYDLVKNSRLKKYEIVIEEIGIDIYLPFYSDLGIPLEKVIKNAVLMEGFMVPPAEMLIILKQKAWFNRRLSLKGRKDLVDIFSLLKNAGFNWQKYFTYLDNNKLGKYKKDLRDLLNNTISLEELGLNRRQLAKLKKNWLVNFS